MRFPSTGTSWVNQRRVATPKPYHLSARALASGSRPPARCGFMQEEGFTGWATLCTFSTWKSYELRVMTCDALGCCVHVWGKRKGYLTRRLCPLSPPFSHRRLLFPLSFSHSPHPAFPSPPVFLTFSSPCVSFSPFLSHILFTLPPLFTTFPRPVSGLLSAERVTSKLISVAGTLPTSD